MPVVFRTPIRTDFVEKYPMAKPVDLHDAHVIEYGIESQWKAHKADFHQPCLEELWEA